MRYAHAETLGDKLFYTADITLQFLNNLFRTSPREFIDIETIEDGETIVMSDGTLLSVIAVDGVSKAVLQDEFIEIIDHVERKLSAYMVDGCHYISTFFSRDTDGIHDEIDRIYGGARETARRLDLELQDVLDEQCNVLADYCQKERSLILAWTNMRGLSKDEKKLNNKYRVEQRKGIPLANNAQDIGMGVAKLIVKHKSFVDELRQDLSDVFITSHVVDVNTHLREIREGIDSEWTGQDWEPSLPGDPLPLRLEDSYNPDASGVLWPRLRDQLFPRASEDVDYATIKIGDTYFAPITVELLPKTPEPFQSLFTRLNKEKVPWRLHMLIKSDGLRLLGFKEFLASVLEWTPGTDNNRYLVEVKKELTRLKDAGEEIIQQQIALCTWAPASDKDLLDMRRATLARCVQGWGTCDVAPAEGDVLESTMSSLPGAIIGSIGNPGANTLYDAVKMSPLTRPASPWQTGSQPLRTADGKIIPYQAYSKQQAHWTTLIFAPMGFGKTVFMASSNLGLILSPDIDELPFISQIDIGPGMRGLVSLLRNALPKEKQHLVMYEKLMNTKRYSVNVFDTHLGLRHPLSNQNAFLISFISYLATPDDKDYPHDGVEGVATSLVEQAYKRCSDRTTAFTYERQRNTKIDDLLDKLKFEADPRKTKWWDVVDFLYTNDYKHEATLAQRYAVPNLLTVSMLANDPRITSIYGKMTISDTGETMPEYMYRKLTEALNKYPIISGETQFDLGEARIISLDLDEVAKGEGMNAKRRTGLMYMVAYYILTHRFFFGKDHIQEMEAEVGPYKVDYRPYHTKEINSVAKLPKRFCIDEKHRVKGLSLVEDQMDRSIVEGRKWKIEIMQASQLPNDFSEKSIEVATNVFILGAGTAANIQKVADTFKLSDTMQKHLSGSLRKPSKAGSTLLALIDTDKGKFEHFLMSTQGPTFLWATNSTRDDAYVRDTLAMEIGEVEARSLLVSEYPAGNLDEEIEKRKRMKGLERRKEQYMMEDLSNRDELDEETEGVLNEIVQDLLQRHKMLSEKQLA